MLLSSRARDHPPLHPLIPSFAYHVTRDIHVIYRHTINSIPSIILILITYKELTDRIPVVASIVLFIYRFAKLTSIKNRFGFQSYLVTVNRTVLKPRVVIQRIPVKDINNSPQKKRKITRPA